MKIHFIVAYSQNRAIGKDNALLWHLADDMAFFKKLTMGKTVLMGRKTYESLPPRFRPLPHRLNLVVSSQPPLSSHDNLHWFSDIDKALSYCTQNEIEELFVIGGGVIYRSLIDKADTIYATEVDVILDGDTFFPEINEAWSRECIAFFPSDSKNEYPFHIVQYTRKHDGI